MLDPAAGRNDADSPSNAVREPESPLQRRLADIRARHPQCDPIAVAEVVRAVLATMSGDLTARETTLLAEVEELGRTIAAARSDIAALQVDDITASHIPAATDELDAIVAHTAAATDSILEVCESLDEVAVTLANGPRNAVKAAAAEKLTDATTKIYEACGFQDITGQRISKVVAALKAIDAKVANLIATFSETRLGPEVFDAGMLAIEEPTPEELLRGPQLPAAAMAQDDIDRLMATLA